MVTFDTPYTHDRPARWWCEGCGYGNIGSQPCAGCGALAPADIRGDGAPVTPTEPVPAGPVQRAGSRAGRTVVGIIVVNLVIQVGVFVAATANHMDQAAIVRLSLGVGLAFYAASALWVLARSASLGLRPHLGRETALVGAAEGFVVGGGLALLMVGVLRLLLGHPVLDPTAALLAADGAAGPLLIGALLIVVAAPVVEELIFRGFLAEAFRAKGRREAIVASAVAFSIAHLRLAQFRYYLFLGVVLAIVYMRRGLIASICGHAAFNGMLLVVAVAATHGPVVQAQAAGARVTLPAAWVTESGVAGDDLVANGPVGSQLELAHVDAAVTLPPADVLARSLRSEAVPLPRDFSVDATSVSVVELPAGRAVSANAKVGGHDGHLVMVPQGSRLWLLAFRSAGSARDGTDFDAILHSWRLP